MSGSISLPATYPNVTLSAYEQTVTFPDWHRPVSDHRNPHRAAGLFG
jgi:hypothetical protein